MTLSKAQQDIRQSTSISEIARFIEDELRSPEGKAPSFEKVFQYAMDNRKIFDHFILQSLLDELN